MRSIKPSKLPFVDTLPGIAFLAVALTLLFFGGASRADVLGQTVVRFVALCALILVTLAGPHPNLTGVRWIAGLIGASLILCLVQLIPLPPGLWTAFPGREPFTQAAQIAGEVQPWRPISLVPGATINALASLLVPAAFFVLLRQLSEIRQNQCAGLLLILTAMSMMAALVQFGSVDFSLPWSDRDPNQPSGFFANRNHFALFASFGILIAPIWAAQGTNETLIRRGALALGLIVLFALSILASGSRAGLALGAFSILFGSLIAYPIFRQRLRRFPKWLVPAFTTGTVAMISALIVVSFLADRAASINRALTIDFGQDMRSRGLPIVWDMAQHYFPVGTGFGSFDPLFRLHEPHEFLTSEYFNHAHNDVLEIALNGGILGLILLGTSIVYWFMLSIRAWRNRDALGGALSKIGSVMIGLTLLASFVDYPARTPLIMAILVIAATWLSQAANNGTAPLPHDNPPL